MFAGRLLPYVIMELDVCWKFAGHLLDHVNTLLEQFLNKYLDDFVPSLSR